MRILALGCSIALLAACATGERAPAPDTTAAGTETGPATIALADVAGRWDVTATPESGTDTSATLYTLNATSDTTGWTITFKNRPDQPVAMRVVSVDGDSIVTESGPFESARRKGVQVTTRSVMRMAGPRLVGSTHARYATTGADSVLVLRTDATRAP